MEATAPFFASRYADMPWSILTPERSVRWDGSALEFGPAARREDAPPADAGEQLWLTYYESIFNPARLKLAMMQREMPRRWPPPTTPRPTMSANQAEACKSRQSVTSHGSSPSTMSSRRSRHSSRAVSRRCAGRS